MLIFLLLYSMIEGSHTQQLKGRHQQKRDTKHRNLLVELNYRHVGDKRQYNSGDIGADMHNNPDRHNNPDQYQHIQRFSNHHGNGHVDRGHVHKEEKPTPTSTPSVTDEANQGTCSENSCKMGECDQVGAGIRICKCMRGYVGHRCSELMVNLADYVEAHPETKKKIKIIAEKSESAVASLNHRFYHWSKKQIKKDQNAKKRAKKRNHLNSEEVQNHQIIHSAFQSAFGDKDSVVVNSVDSSNQPDSRREKTDTRNDRHELRGSKQESKSERREPGHDREKPGRKKHDRRGARNSLTLNRHRRNVADVFPTIDRSDPIAHLVLCIEDCQTVLSYSSQLCPAHKLAVELRIEESDWHHIPVNRVKCCTANVSDTCEERSQPVVTV